MRSKRLFGLAVSCGLLIGGLVFATPSATPAVHADGPTPTATPNTGGGGGTGGNGNGGGGHTG
jgi:hypothetical protein